MNHVYKKNIIVPDIKILSIGHGAFSEGAQGQIYHSRPLLVYAIVMGGIQVHTVSRRQTVTDTPRDRE